MGSTTFKANIALAGAAIYNNPANDDLGLPAAVTTFPADTVFVDNDADVSKDDMHIFCFFRLAC